MRTLRSRHGFTLIEVMITSLILIVVVAGASAVFLVFARKATVQRLVTQVTDETALASTLLTRELRLVGFGQGDGAFTADVGGVATVIPALRASPLSNYVLDGDGWSPPYADDKVYPELTYSIAKVAIEGSAPDAACAGGLGGQIGQCCFPDVLIRPDNLVVVRGDSDGRTFLSQNEPQWDGSLNIREPDGWTPRADEWVLVTDGARAAAVCITGYTPDVPSPGFGVIDAGSTADAAGKCQAGVGPELFPPGGFPAGAIVTRVRSSRFSVVLYSGAAGEPITRRSYLQRQTVNPVTMMPVGPPEVLVPNIFDLQLSYGFDANGNDRMDDSGRDWEWRDVACPAPLPGRDWPNCIAPLTNPQQFRLELARARTVRYTVRGRHQAPRGCNPGEEMMADSGGLVAVEDQGFTAMPLFRDNAVYRAAQGEVALRNLSLPVY